MNGDDILREFIREVIQPIVLIDSNGVHTLRVSIGESRWDLILNPDGAPVTLGNVRAVSREFKTILTNKNTVPSVTIPNPEDRLFPMGSPERGFADPRKNK